MKIREGLILLFVVTCLMAQLPDYKPVAPLKEVVHYTKSNGSSFEKSGGIQFSYTATNAIKSEKEYSLTSENVTASGTYRYVYNNERLDSLIKGSAKKAFHYDEYGAYIGYTLKDSEKGVEEAVIYQVFNSDGKVTQKKNLKKSLDDKISKSESAEIRIQYDSKGRFLQEQALVSLSWSGTKGESKNEKYLQKTDYSYDGDSLLVKKVSRSKDAEFSKLAAFFPVSEVSYLYLTGLSDEDITVEEYFFYKNGSKLPVKKRTLSRNREGRVIEESMEFYNAELDGYELESITSRVYDSETGNITEEISKKKSSDGFDETRSEYLYRDDVVSLAGNESLNKKIGVTIKNSILTFDLDTPSRVSLQIYSIDGRKVMTLFEERNLNNGSYTLDLKPIAQFQGVATGMYVYQLQAMGKQFSGKIALP